MSESQSENTPPRSSNAELLEFASAILDGIQPDATTATTGSELSESPAVRQFQRDARAVGSLLRMIPVQKVGKPLVQSDELQREGASSAVEIVAVRDVKARPPRQKFAGVVSILMMVGCLLIAVVAPHTDDAELPRITASWKIRKAAANVVAEFPSEEQWNVVVVRMDDQDRTAAMQAVQKIVKEHGYDFARSAGKEMPEWLGVVLSAGADESKALLDDLRNKVSIESVEQDPLRIAESSREELIAAVQESLRYPTMSELHHGKVYLAMPENDDKQESVDTLIAAAKVAADKSMSRQEGHGDEPRVPSLVPPTSDEPALTSEHATSPRDGVMLVVFQFAPEVAVDLKI